MVDVYKIENESKAYSKTVRAESAAEAIHKLLPKPSIEFSYEMIFENQSENVLVFDSELEGRRAKLYVSRVWSACHKS